MSDHDTTVLPGPEPEEPQETKGGGKRTAIIAATSVAVAAVLGGGAFAIAKLSGGGAQPAEAIPANAIAYVSLDLDPSASQKIEAVKLFRKFPALKDKLSESGDDLRKTLFDDAIKTTDCDLTFKKDVEPWLGNRIGLAAVKSGDSVEPMFAVQVKDADTATKSVKELLDCTDGKGGVAVQGDYLVVTEAQADAKKFAASAAKANLAETDGYQKWSDEVGDRGIMNFYVAKSAAGEFADLMKQQSPGLSGDESELVQQSVDSFEGLAGTLRFSDGGMELATVGGTSSKSRIAAVDPAAGKLAAGLPDDTGLVFALSLAPTYVDELFDQMSKQTEFETSVKQIEDQLGLSLPEDLKTLFGKGLALSVGAPPESLQSISGPQDLNLGLSIEGDTTKIGEIIDKLEKGAGQDLDSVGVIRKTSEDRFVLASNEDYAAALTSKGKLGDSAAFKSVVSEPDNAASVMFINFDSAWTKTITDMVRETGVAAGDAVGEVEANLEPLQAFGFSSWQDGDKGHVLLRVSTD